MAPGAYNESPTLNKSVTLKSTGGRDVTTINLQTVPNYTGSMLISGQTVTVDGFTITGYDAVGDGLASTNVYVEYPATNVLLKNNRFKIGQIGSGTTYDDGFGVITAYNPSNAIASLSVTDNIFMPLNAQGQRAFYINPDVNQFTFKGNEITGNFVGRAISEARDSLIENNIITGVGAAGSRSAGIGVWGYIDPAVYGKATIRGNTISGVATRHRHHLRQPRYGRAEHHLAGRSRREGLGIRRRVRPEFDRDSREQVQQRRHLCGAEQHVDHSGCRE